MPVTEYSFNQSFNFRHTASVRQLRKQALCLRLITKKAKGGEPALVSTYRVDLFTLAIGPVHHAIELMRGENSLIGLKKQQKYVGRLTADINFTQTQKVEIQLTDLQADIFERQLSHAYQASFRVVTFNDVGDSTKSYMIRPLIQKQTVDPA